VHTFQAENGIGFALPQTALAKTPYGLAQTFSTRRLHQLLADEAAVALGLDGRPVSLRAYGSF